MQGRLAAGWRVRGTLTGRTPEACAFRYRAVSGGVLARAGLAWSRKPFQSAGIGRDRPVWWATMSAPGSAAPTPKRSQVFSWALWDFGSLGVSSVVGTFVFSVYLTRGVGDDLPGDTSPASWLGRALAIAGLLVAVLAPVIGVWVDAPWRRRRVLALLTGAVVLTTAAMAFIRDD